VSSIAREPNVLGAFFVSTLFLPASLFLTAPTKRQGWAMLLPLLLALRGVMVTFSRGGYLACVTGGLAVCWRRSKRLFLAAAAALILMVANPWLLPAGVRYRFEMTVTHTQQATGATDITKRLEPSAANRIRIWRGGLAMVKDHPWWGVGYGAFPRFLSYYTGGDIGYIDAHNLYLLIAAEMGIPTLLVFLSMLGLAVYESGWLARHGRDRILRAIGLGALGGIVAFTTANFFTPCLDALEAAGYFWVLIGLVARAVMLERQHPGNGEQAAGSEA
jgi:putative inorganic carbon (HCO3(-)) transporter